MKKIILFVLIALLALPGYGQITCDTSAKHIEYLKAKVGNNKFKKVVPPKAPTNYSDAAGELYIIEKVLFAVKHISPGIVLEGHGVGNNARESVGAALQDIGLSVLTRVNVQITTTNSNGKESISSRTVTTSDFFLPEGVTTVFTERLGKNNYFSKVTIDVSAYLIGIEEKLARLDVSIAEALYISRHNMTWNNANILAFLNGESFAQYKLWDNPLSRRYDNKINEKLKLVVRFSYPEAEVMYVTLEKTLLDRRLPKVFPFSLEEYWKYKGAVDETNLKAQGWTFAK
ncbi:MAG: hypothetical protein IK041_04235 [Bacteroidales bacterium]|nr:hypothetical protein [Bacteroidales bacterium]